MKQLEPVGPTGEALVDYTIHDAIKVGFRDILLVVREPTERLFREHLNRVWPGREFRFAIQSRDGRAVSEDGSWKPWGTGHAVLSAAGEVDGPFAVLNADDFYGRESLRLLADWLDRPAVQDAGAMVAFRLGSTLSPHGAVSRAVCTIRRDDAGPVADPAHGGLGFLTGLSERADITAGMAGLSAETPVSMNLWTLPFGIVGALRSGFEAFRALHEHDATSEFLLPDLIGRQIDAGRLSVRVLESPSQWMGLTFAADRPAVRRRLSALVSSGAYPEQLATGPDLDTAG